MILPFSKYEPNIHKDAVVMPSADIIGRVNLAKDSSIWFGAVLRGDINRVDIGRRSNVQDNSVLHVERKRACIVKDDVTIGHQATVHACTVEDGVLVGIGACILNRAHVGKYSIIGAGAVVLENTKIPDYSLVVGTPAKVIRKLTKAEIKALKTSAKNYVQLSKEYLKNPHLLSHSRQVTPINDLSHIF